MDTYSVQPTEANSEVTLKQIRGTCFMNEHTKHATCCQKPVAVEWPRMETSRQSFDVAIHDYHFSRTRVTWRELSRSQRPRGLRRGSATACLLGLWVRISPGALMSLCC